MMTFPRKSRAAAVMSLIRIGISNSPLDRIHQALETEIDRGSRRLDEAEQRGESEMMDALIDEECDDVEELLGMAFVAGQSFINKVRSQLKTLNEAFLQELGVQVSYFSLRNPMNEILKQGAISNTSPYSSVEIVNGVANYCKHRDEWKTRGSVKGTRLVQLWDVDSMPSNQQSTVELAVAIGLCPGATGNLRHAAKILGIEKYEDLYPMRRELTSWANGIYERVKVEFDTAIASSTQGDSI